MNILGPDVGITDLLDFEINAKLKAEQDERRAGKIKYHPLRPSSAGHCSRKLALELMEYRGHAFYERPVLEPNVWRLFELGHAVEFAALKSFQLIKVLEQKYKQQSVSLFKLDRGPDFPSEMVEGSCDFVLYSKQWRCIGDVKSKKDSFSAYRTTKWDEELEKLSNLPSLAKISPTSFFAWNLERFIQDLGDDWLVDNLMQLNLYARSSFMQEREIDFAFLYRYNKNDSRHMEIRFKPSEEVFNLVQYKFQKIATMVDKKEVPTECDFPIGSLRYAFCDCHKMLPYSETHPLKAFFATLPPKIFPKETTEMEFGKALEKSYEKLRKAEKHLIEKEKAEAKIVKICCEEKVSKVKFKDGEIYQVKLLKSPREHFELRRSK